MGHQVIIVVTAQEVEPLVQEVLEHSSQIKRCLYRRWRRHCEPRHSGGGESSSLVLVN